MCIRDRAFKEVNKEVIAFYHHSLQKLEFNETNRQRQIPLPKPRRMQGQVPLDRDLGLISDLDDAIDLLEYLWNSESYTKDNSD